MKLPKLRHNTGYGGEEGIMAVEPTPIETRARDEAFVRQCSLGGLQERLPLRWLVPPDTPPSPKQAYRSRYVYPGWDDLWDRTAWEYLSDFDWVLRLVDFEGLRLVLAQRLGWISARGKTPFDPLSMFLLISWQLVNGWTRAQALRNLRDPRYADYVRCFGFENDDYPSEGGVRYFLTALGRYSQIDGATISVELDHDQRVEIAIQYLNQLIAGAVALLHAAELITPEAWQKALVCPDGSLHDAASRMRCTAVQASCYAPTSPTQPRPCPAKEKGKEGCPCDELACAQVCRHAPVRDPAARCVWYTGSNQPKEEQADTHSDPSIQPEDEGELHYGYRSLALQLAEPARRFSIVLLDDFMPASAREENPAAALLLQLKQFYPDLGVEAVAGDAAFGYYACLHTVYQMGAKRVIDLRRHAADRDKSEWTVRGYSDTGRPVCEYGYAFTANGFDARRQRHKWFCGQACLKGTAPLVELDNVTYPPEECGYRCSDLPFGKTINVAETFKNSSIRLARDIPVGTPTWKRLYHRARNASEFRNAVLEGWGLKRLPVFGDLRGRALTALADVWLNLSTLARLVREATLAALV
jgi:hypothetical protein